MSAPIVQLGKFSVQVTFKYQQLSQHWSKIATFAPFVSWCKAWEHEHDKKAIVLNGIEIQDVDYFGPRIGFLKFRLDVRWSEDGAKLPGIVFMRGHAVGILLVLLPHDAKEGDEPMVVMVRQARIPVPTMDSWEMVCCPLLTR
ncbi:hypothetical protein HDU91_000007 [Kappamyces sp. JEL0680]|nr:hypothetical protein HDU91_000007 [Kappamyces sp. JEL0680]